jgi:hypothetical protein
VQKEVNSNNKGKGSVASKANNSVSNSANKGSNPGATQNGTPPAGDLVDSKWSCRRCTFLNLHEMDRCYVCEAPRSSNVPTALPGDIDEQGHRSPPPHNPKSPSTPEARFNDFQTDGAAAPEKAPTPSNGGKAKVKVKGKGRQGSSTSETITVENLPDWTCQYCTFSCNAGWNTTCDSCGRPKAGAQPKPPPPASPIEMSKDSVKYFHRPGVPEPPVTQNGGNSEGMWACGQCTYENPDTVALCTMCGAGRPDTDSKSWACPKCTLINPAKNSKCRACHYAPSQASSTTTPQPPGPSNVQPPPKAAGSVQWRCSCCTFLNKSEGPSSNRCRVCKANRDGSSPNQRLRPVTPLHCSLGLPASAGQFGHFVLDLELLQSNLFVYCLLVT